MRRAKQLSSGHSTSVQIFTTRTNFHNAYMSEHTRKFIDKYRLKTHCGPAKNAHTTHFKNCKKDVATYATMAVGWEVNSTPANFSKYSTDNNFNLSMCW